MSEQPKPTHGDRLSALFLIVIAGALAAFLPGVVRAQSACANGYIVVGTVYNGQNQSQVSCAGLAGTNTPTPTPSPTPSYPAFDSIATFTPGPTFEGFFPSSPFHASFPPSPVFTANAVATAYLYYQCYQSPPATCAPVSAATPLPSGTNYPIDQLEVDESITGTGDSGDPTYYNSGNASPIYYNCSGASYSAYICALASLQGTLGYYPPPGVRSGDGDHHLNVINPLLGYEDDGYGVATPYPNPAATFTATTWGRCSLSGNGTACGYSNAIGIAQSIGLIRPDEVLYCMNGPGASNPHCDLGHVLAMAEKCNNTGYQFPATGTDAQCFNNSGTNFSSATVGAPEGMRFCLNQTDATINSTFGQNSYQAAIFRTWACPNAGYQHWGAIIRDTTAGGTVGHGYKFQWNGAASATAFGMPDGWATIASLSGISEVGSTYTFQFPMSGFPLLIQVCTNAHSDGLCD